MLQQNLLCIDFVEQILPPLKVLCNKMLEAAQPLSHCFEMCAKCMGGSATGGSQWVFVCVCVCVRILHYGENKTEQNMLKHLCLGARMQK